MDFLNVLQEIIISLTDNVYFPEPYPAPVPSTAKLSAETDIFRQACHEVLNRDLRKIPERDASRDRINSMLKPLALYLELMADGDMVKLKSTGFPLRQDAVRKTSGGPLPAPADLRVKHGLVSGSLDIHVAKLAGAHSYAVQISSLVDPHDESGWRHATVSSTAQHILLQGLTPLQNLWVRVCGVDANGNGLWTDPVRIAVV